MADYGNGKYLIGKREIINERICIKRNALDQGCHTNKRDEEKSAGNSS